MQTPLIRTPATSDDRGPEPREEPNRSDVDRALVPTGHALEPKVVYEPFISERLTWNQICERYPDEWVCLVEIDRPEEHNFAFRDARVVGHGKGPRDPYLQARAFHHRYDNMGHYYTGRIRPLLRGMVVE